MRTKKKLKPLRIGQLAELSGERKSTLKHYTERGLLPFEQEARGLRRMYDMGKSLTRLKDIVKLKQVGLTIEEIKEQY